MGQQRMMIGNDMQVKGVSVGEDVGHAGDGVDQAWYLGFWQSRGANQMTVSHRFGNTNKITDIVLWRYTRDNGHWLLEVIGNPSCNHITRMKIIR